MCFDWAMFAGGSLAQSAAISSSFLRLSLFPWTVRPGQAGWTASSSPRTRAGNVKPLGGLIQNEVSMAEEDTRWGDYLNGKKYKITEQGGKFGLNIRNTVLLEPKYSYVEITNHNVPLSDPRIRKCVVDPYCLVDEWNFPIVHADGKYGLIDGVIDTLVFGLECDRIVKLTYEYYLCSKSGTCTLYKFDAGRPEISAVFPESNKINLPELLNVLQTRHPEARTQLSKTLFVEGDHYISEFWHYHISISYPEVGMVQYVPLATRKAILSTNFEVTPLELVICLSGV